MDDPFLKIAQCFDEFSTFKGHAGALLDNLLVQVDDQEPSRELVTATIASISALIDKTSASLTFPQEYFLARLNRKG